MFIPPSLSVSQESWRKDGTTRGQAQTCPRRQEKEHKARNGILVRVCVPISKSPESLSIVVIFVRKAKQSSKPQSAPSVPTPLVMSPCVDPTPFKGHATTPAHHQDLAFCTRNESCHDIQRSRRTLVSNTSLTSSPSKCTTISRRNFGSAKQN